MTTEQKIISYLGNISRGVLQLKQQQAAHIIDMVLYSEQCRAILHRYNYQQRKWEVMQSINTDAAAIEQAIKESLIRKPVDHCYRYDLYNEANELHGYIYSLNPELF